MIKRIISAYANSLYQDVMSRSYHQARVDALEALPPGGKCLDCGAGSGGQFQRLREISHSISPQNYVGVEWDSDSVSLAKQKGLSVSNRTVAYILFFLHR